MPAALDRLKKRSEFLAVAATNRRWTAPGLVLQVRQRPTEADADRASVKGQAPVEGLRVGFTATKKIGNAVKRNRARRRLRAAVADVLANADAPGQAAAKAADLVLVARQGTIDRPYADLKNDLRTALGRLGIVR